MRKESRSHSFFIACNSSTAKAYTQRTEKNGVPIKTLSAPCALTFAKSSNAKGVTIKSGIESILSNQALL